MTVDLNKLAEDIEAMLWNHYSDMISWHSGHTRAMILEELKQHLEPQPPKEDEDELAPTT